MRRQLSSQISSAVTEVEIGAEDLEDDDDVLDVYFYKYSVPASTEHVEHYKAGAEQEG